MPRSTVNDVLVCLRLTLAEIPQASVEQHIQFAADTVEFYSPLDETDPRSVRAEPLRKRAEIFFAAASCARAYAPFQWLLFPAKEILGAEGLQTGSDFPTSNEAFAAWLRIAEDFEKQAFDTIKIIRPVTATIGN